MAIGILGEVYPTKSEEMDVGKKCPFWVGKDKCCKLDKFTINECTRGDGLNCSFAKYRAWEAGMSVKNLIEWCGIKKMCDRIKMPDGVEYDSVREDGKCLCNSQDYAILEWIVNRIRLEIGMSLIIERDPFGWSVSLDVI